MTPSVIDYDPHHITILASAKGRPMSKAWTRDENGAWSHTAFNQSAWFDVRGTYRVATLGDILGLLQYANDDATIMAIRGELRTDVHVGNVSFASALPRTSRVVDGRVSSQDVPYSVAHVAGQTRPYALRRLTAFVDVPRHFATIDVDGLDWSDVGLSAPDFSGRGAEAVWRYITRNLPESSNLGCVYQWSSSAGIKPGARLHFYVVTDVARDGEWWNALYQATGEPRNTKAGALLCRNGNGKFDFDPAVFRTVQPNYLANPTFHGADDPIDQRVGVIPGVDFPTVAITDAFLKAPEATLAPVEGDTRVTLRNRVTNEHTPSTARGSLWEDWQTLKTTLGHPANVRLGLRRIEPVLAQLRAAAPGTLNDTRFEATKGLRRTLALELMGVEGLLDALCEAMASNPHAAHSAAEYRPEFERALTYAFKGYEPATMPTNEQLSAHPVTQLNARYLDASIYAAPARVVAVRSPMGTGKSVSIHAYMEASKYPVVRAVAPRRSLVRTMATAWGVEHYTDDGTDSARLSTTLHSLHKTPAKQGQLLVIDEVEQAVEALLCEVERPEVVLASLREHFRCASKVILADAHMGWQTALLLELVGVDLAEVQVFDNEWRAPSSRKLTMYESDKDTYNTACTTALEDLNKLMASEGGLFYLACTSKGEAERVSLYFNEERPQARQLLITSDTSQDAHVQAWFSNPDGESSNYDIIVASPSVQSGVSLTVKCTAAVMFGRMGAWTSPNKAVQQLGRARNAAQRWWVLDTSAQSAETSVDAILASWNAARHATYGSIAVRGADGVWCSIPHHHELLLATARYEARRNLELSLHVERVRELLCESEGYEIVPKKIVLSKQRAQEQKDVRAGLRAAQTDLKLEEAARIFATPCPTDGELGLLLAKQELTLDEKRAATHGLAARLLDEAPTLADIERTQLDHKWYRQSTLLGLLSVSADDFDLLRLQDLERVIDGHTSSLKLQNTPIAEAHFARELVAASGLAFMIAPETEPEQRQYTPDDHWTDERVASVQAVLERHGKSYKAGATVRSVVHKLLNSMFSVSFDRKQVRRDGKAISVYVADDSHIKSLLRWTAGARKTVEQAHMRVRMTTEAPDTLRVVDPKVSMAVEPIPASELQPLNERLASELGQRASLNKLFSNE